MDSNIKLSSNIVLKCKYEDDPQSYRPFDLLPLTYSDSRAERFLSPYQLIQKKKRLYYATRIISGEEVENEDKINKGSVKSISWFDRIASAKSPSVKSQKKVSTVPVKNSCKEEADSKNQEKLKKTNAIYNGIKRVKVIGKYLGYYNIIPYEGKLKKITPKVMQSMFISMKKMNKEVLIPVSVLLDEHIIYIAKNNYGKYVLQLLDGNGLELRETYYK